MKKTRIFMALALALPLLAATSTSAADGYTDGYDLALGGNYDAAFAKWLPLAKEGDGRAQFNLGLMYHSGLHVASDEQLAVQWYIKAAENGIREAQEYLVVGYQEGWFGLPRDQKMAHYWQKRLDENHS